MSEDEKPQRDHLKYWIALACLIMFVLLAWLGYEFRVADRYGFDNAAKHGDMFGGLNTLFAGLAFAALIVTIWMQAEELSLQRRDMETMAKAQVESQNALKQQATLMAQTAGLQAASHLLVAYEEKRKHLEQSSGQFGNDRNLDDSIDHYANQRDSCIAFLEHWYELTPDYIKEPPTLRVELRVNKDAPNTYRFIIANPTHFTIRIHTLVIVFKQKPASIHYFSFFVRANDKVLEHGEVLIHDVEAEPAEIDWAFAMDSQNRRHAVPQVQIDELNRSLLKA